MVRAWRCEVCGYVHEGAEPPEICPVCGAPAADFTPVAAPAPAPAAPTCTVRRVVVIGGGVAGTAAAEAARQAAPDAEVTLLAAENEPPYYRLSLTRLLAGEIGADAMPLHPLEWYGQQRIDLRTGVTVNALRLDTHTVELAQGEALPFDRLVLATGADPFRPPWAGGAQAIRTLADVRQVLAALHPGLRCVCVGGGVLGLETAGALARQGVVVDLLANSDWLMPHQLTRAGGEVLAKHVHGLGIRLHTAVQVQALTAAGVALADGGTLPADLVLVTTGIRPRTALAAAAGLRVQQGVVVDDFLATSHPDVFAAGDVAEHRGAIYGLWPAAQYQGQLAGWNAVGRSAAFGGLPRSCVLKVLGLHVFSIGGVTRPPADARVLEERTDSLYLNFTFVGGRLIGAIVIGRDGLDAALKKAVEAGTDLSALLARIPTAFAAALADERV